MGVVKVELLITTKQEHYLVKRDLVISKILMAVGLIGLMVMILCSSKSVKAMPGADAGSKCSSGTFISVPLDDIK